MNRHRKVRAVQTHGLPELYEFEHIAFGKGHLGRVRVENIVRDGTLELPIYSLVIGSDDPAAPCFVLVGGVHGIERIGTRIINGYLKSLFSLMSWDMTVKKIFEKSRLVVMPLLNPLGMLKSTRANGNGVDLMRNAPVEGDERSLLEIYRGQTYSAKLPWYRGDTDNMEIEARSLIACVERETWKSNLVVSLDIHSGFGVRDRVWFPYAKTKHPFPNLPEAYALRRLLAKSYPNHIYKFEPQSRQYTTHGDLWDYMYDLRLQEKPESTFIPFCLEIGSWNWIRKNPLQILSPFGVFNPVAFHREQRSLRRHILLLDFF